MNEFKKINLQNEKISRFFWKTLHVDMITFFILSDLRKVGV